MVRYFDLLEGAGRGLRLDLTAYRETYDVDAHLYGWFRRLRAGVHLALHGYIGFGGIVYLGDGDPANPLHLGASTYLHLGPLTVNVYGEWCRG